MRPGLRTLSKVASDGIPISPFSIPVFLCPALLRPAAKQPSRLKRPPSRPKPFTTRARPSAAAAATAALPSVPHGDHTAALLTPARRALPRSCPGCGALTQTVHQHEAGFYSPTRSAVKSYLNSEPGGSASEDHIFNSAIRKADPEVLKQLGLDQPQPAPPEDAQPSIPICDRCHNLIHHHAGVPIHHPTIESIEATIAESPHKYNHVYHVLDAADFPMSLIPQLHRHLELARPRTQNRRSKSHRYVRGTLTEVSFIITRSDLLAPQKEQVDRLMPYMIEVLRDALGRSGKNVRLGNVRCVSAKRGWWTKELKEEIWRRGGGGWLVGKVNVGKSNLFEAVFPKGRTGDVDLDFDRARNLSRLQGQQLHESVDDFGTSPMSESSAEAQSDTLEADEDIEGGLNGTLMLPPPQEETLYPVMPITSSLPGTTASPIRVPFGGGKGELIDLPGLARGNLGVYVRPEDRLDLIMKSRIAAERAVLKPGQSLLLGGLIRITPTTPDLIFMTHSFVSLKPHVSSTERAAGIQSGQRESGVPTITEPSARVKTASAGKFQLQWDVTKSQAGPLTSKSAGKLKPAQLPFIVYSADILIEGCGWIEVVAQVRRRRRGFDSDQDGATKSVNSFADEEAAAANNGGVPYPEVEVFSPEGKFVAVRKPMGAYLLNRKKPQPANARKSRPRPSMRSAKAQRQPST